MIPQSRLGYLVSLVANYDYFCEELNNCYSMVTSSFIHKAGERYFTDPTANDVERKMSLEKIVDSINYAASASHEDVNTKDWLNTIIDICNKKKKGHYAFNEFNDKARVRLGVFFSLLNMKLHST